MSGPPVLAHVAIAKTEPNTPDPPKKGQTFTEHADNQQSGETQAFEGERATTEDNNVLDTPPLEREPVSQKGARPGQVGKLPTPEDDIEKHKRVSAAEKEKVREFLTSALPRD